LLTKEGIGNSLFVESALQLGLVEMGMTRADRLRSDIGDGCDSCSLKKGEEAYEVVVGVADAENPRARQDLWIELG
jgi:hypothetical protein